MMRSKLQGMTVEQLKAQFADIAVKQYNALQFDEIGKYNRLFEKLMAVESELRLRVGDQRTILLELYHHRNPQVRLAAASATLAVAPEAARAMLHEIQDSREFPQAGYAGMTLWTLEQGIFKPT